MNKYLAVLTYDGTDFKGSQKQANFRTVQGSFEDALMSIHKEFIPRLGGISLISFYTIFLFDYQNYENNLLLYFFISFLVLLLGFFEDISEVLNSKNRAILSTFIILILIFNFDYRIDSIGFELVDNLFKYEIIIF